jgi:hypothetical protein
MSITNEHIDKIDRKFEIRYESTIEPITYENPPICPKLSTIIHKTSQVQQMNPIKSIKTPKIDNDAIPTLSLTSVSCTQKNRNE